MRISAFAFAIACIAAGAAPAMAAGACASSGNEPSGPPVSGGSSTLYLYNNVNAPAMIYRSDSRGQLRVETDVAGMDVSEVNTSRGFVYLIETSLDGIPHCAGAILITANGECHVSLDQDADQFYLSPEGSCETF